MNTTSKIALDGACENLRVNIWLSLRTLIELTDDPSNAELDLLALIENDPAIQREITRRKNP